MHMQQRTIQTGQRAGRRLIWSNKNMSNNMDWRFQHKEQDTKLIHQEICLLHGHIMLVWSSAHQSCENILVLIKNMHSLQRKHCQIRPGSFEKCIVKWRNQINTWEFLWYLQRWQVFFLLAMLPIPCTL